MRRVHIHSQSRSSSPALLAVGCLQFLLLSPEPGVAQDAPLSWGPSVSVRPKDAAQVRDVITHQLSAFARQDANDAYVNTAPNVRTKFPSAASFYAMAHTHYAPLFDMERHAFSSVRGAAATATQAETWSQNVEIGTRANEHWSAVYGLERQPDGSIAITSCVLVRRPDTAS